MQERFNEFKDLLKRMGYQCYFDDISLFEDDRDFYHTLPVIVELNKLGVKSTVPCKDIIVLYLLCSVIMYCPKAVDYKDTDCIDSLFINYEKLLNNNPKMCRDAVNLFKDYISNFDYTKSLRSFTDLAKCIAYQCTGKDFNLDKLNNNAILSFFDGDFSFNVFSFPDSKISYLDTVYLGFESVYRFENDGKFVDIDVDDLLKQRLLIIGVSDITKCSVINGENISEKEVNTGFTVHFASPSELRELIENYGCKE